MNDEKRTTSKYITAILEPSDTGLTVEDLASTRGDGLSAIMQGPDGALQPLTAKEIDPHCVDLSSIRRWLTNCDSLHSYTCQSQASENLRKICLIAVKARRIVEYSSTTIEYLALSYVWGKSSKLVSGSGIPGTVLGALPQTIEDALALTEDLGQEYLWVDLVCIDQSNETRKQEQINIMSDIYQGAYATIIAFSGASADAGLPRIGSTGTGYRQLKCEIDGVQLVGFGPTLSQLAWVLPWASRAWTYQEAILSPKCIYVSDYHVYMECNASTYCETLDESWSPIHRKPHDKEFFQGENWVQQINSGVLRSPLSANINLDDNALRLYSLYTTIYSRRSLTKQSDALNAFAGILQALAKSTYKDGFSWALPHQDLNWALLWQPQGGSHRGKKLFPSWSWLSWKGHVWGGEPTGDGPQQPHRYSFDIIIWNMSTSGFRKVFERSYHDMKRSDCEHWTDDPLAAKFQCENGDSLEQFRGHKVEANDQILCIETFILSFSLEAWVSLGTSENENYRYSKMRVDDADIFVSFAQKSELRTSAGRKGERQFLLLARYIRHEQEEYKDWVLHYLLLLKPGDGLVERSCVVCLQIHRAKLRVLNSLGLCRKRVLLR